MKLTDQIMDEAQELGQTFHSLTNAEVLEHVATACDIRSGISPNSIGGRLALATYTCAVIESRGTVITA